MFYFCFERSLEFYALVFFKAVDELWFFELVEKLEHRGQRVASMRIFNDDFLNRNAINLAFSYMTIAHAICIREGLNKALSFSL